jgi:hypothetical protein
MQTELSEQSEMKFDTLWNKKYNNFQTGGTAKVPIFTRTSYAFGDEAKQFQLRPAQKSGMKFLTSRGQSGLLAHEVGFGKTTSAISKMSEMIQTGQGKRILALVPNEVYDNWLLEIQGGYKQGKPFLGALGRSTTIIPVGNMSPRELRGTLRKGDTKDQKALRQKYGKYTGVVDYTDEEWEMVTGGVLGEFSREVLDYIGQYPRTKGSGVKFKSKVTKRGKKTIKKPMSKADIRKNMGISEGDVIRFRERQVDVDGNIITAYQLEEKGAKAVDRRNYVGTTADYYAFKDEVVKILERVYPNWRDFQSNKDESQRLFTTLFAYLDDIYTQAEQEMLSIFLNDKYSDIPVATGKGGALILSKNLSYDKYDCKKGDYVGKKYETPKQELEKFDWQTFYTYDSDWDYDCNYDVLSWKSGSPHPQSPVRVHYMIEALEKRLTDELILFFNALPNWAKSDLGTWKSWALSDSGIVLMKHSAMDATGGAKLRYPMSTLLETFRITTEKRSIGYSISRSLGMLRKAKYGGIDVGRLNIDAVVVDEAHNFNAIIEKVNARVGDDPKMKSMGRAKNKSKWVGRKPWRREEFEVDNVYSFSFENNQSLVAKGFNFMSLLLYIQNKAKFTQGHLLPKDVSDNVILLTATPFTDNNFQMLSLYFAMNKGLSAEMGVNNAYDFFSTYVSEIWKLDINERGSLSLFPKVDDYYNPKALSNYIKTFADFKVSDAEIQKNRPEKVVVSSIPNNLSEKILKNGNKIKSLVEVTDVQKKMLKNLSDFVIGKNPNMYGFTDEDVKKLLKGTKKKTSTYKYTNEEEEKALEEQIDALSQVNDKVDYETIGINFDELSDLIDSLRQVSEGRNPKVEEYNLMLVEALTADDEEGGEQTTKESDSDAVLKAGGLTEEQLVNQRAKRARMLNEYLAISPYLCTADKEGELGNPYLEEKYGGLTPKSFVESSPKLHYTAKCILELQLKHKKEKTKPSGSVIYCNRVRFVYKGVVYNLFDLISDYLIEVCANKKSKYYGLIKEDETAWLMGSTTSDGGSGSKLAEARKRIQDGFNSGDVKVLMGTDTIREGINLQKNSATMFILQSSYSPVTMMQLQGRIWRQGNPYQYAFIVNVLAKRTVDSFIYSKLDNKITSVREMLGSDVYDFNATQFDVDADENKMQIIRDPRKIAELQWAVKREELSRESLKTASIIRALNRVRSNYEEDRKALESFVPVLNDMRKVIAEQEEKRVYTAIKNKLVNDVFQVKKAEHIEKLKGKQKKRWESKDTKDVQWRSEQIKKIRDAIAEPTEEEINDLVGTKGYEVKFTYTDEVTIDTPYPVIEKVTSAIKEYIFFTQYEFDYGGLVMNNHKLLKRSIDIGNTMSATDEQKQKGRNAELTLEKHRTKIIEGDINELLPKEYIHRYLYDLNVTDSRGYSRNFRNSSSAKWFVIDDTALNRYWGEFTADGGVGETMSRYASFVLGAEKVDSKRENNFEDIPVLIEKQEKIKEKIDSSFRNEDAEISKLEKEAKEKIDKQDKESGVDVDSLVNQFKKLFPLIKKR